MAGGLLEYSGLVTKTKAMRARLLGADDYTAISEYESVTDFIAFLREQPAYAPVFERHGEVAHRGQVEAVIRDSLYMDYCKLYRFSGKRILLNVVLVILCIADRSSDRCILCSIPDRVCKKRQ